MTSVLVYEKNGQFNEFVGGYDEYKMHKRQESEDVLKKQVVKRNLSVNKLSFNEQRELAQLPQKIEQLEEKIAEIQSGMADSKFYQQEEQLIATINKSLAEDEVLLTQLYARWEELEDVEKRNK